MSTQNEELAKLLAKLFIQRKDVKAVQAADGGYRPVRQPWKMKDLRDHVNGLATFGHYTNDQDSLTKLIVFDIDLDTGYCEKSKKATKEGQSMPECCVVGHGSWCEVPMDLIEQGKISSNEEFDSALKIHGGHPRDDWRDRKHPGRNWYKQQLRTMVELISGAVISEFGLRTVSAYSGNKGCHVYAFFDEPTDIELAREMALIILEVAGSKMDARYAIVPSKGKNFFKYNDPDPYTGLDNLTVEVFPKQSSMDGKDLGNLVRLPLGRNEKGPKSRRKSTGEIVYEPTFLIDQRLPYNDLQPHPDPVLLLETGNPYVDVVGESQLG